MHGATIDGKMREKFEVVVLALLGLWEENAGDQDMKAGETWLW